MIRERILFRLFFSLLLLLSFSPFCTYEPTSQIHPNIPARFPNRFPKKCPIHTPTNAIKNVVVPISVAEGIIFTFKADSVMPTAKASILVVIAAGTITVKPNAPFVSLHSPFRFSRIMLIPIMHRRNSATYLETASMYWRIVPPQIYPSVGISAWNPPKYSPAKPCFYWVHFGIQTFAY